MPSACDTAHLRSIISMAWPACDLLYHLHPCCCGLADKQAPLAHIPRPQWGTKLHAAPASAHCCAGWPSALSHSCRTALQEAHRLASDHGDAVACVSLLWGCANQQLFCSACAIYWQTHFQRPVRVSDKQWRAARPCNTPCCRY